MPAHRLRGTVVRRKGDQLTNLAYNFVKIHRTLRPDSSDGCVSDRLWDVKDIVALLEASRCSKRRSLKERLSC